MLLENRYAVVKLTCVVLCSSSCSNEWGGFSLKTNVAPCEFASQALRRNNETITKGKHPWAFAVFTGSLHHFENASAKLFPRQKENKRKVVESACLLQRETECFVKRNRLPNAVFIGVTESYQFWVTCPNTDSYDWIPKVFTFCDSWETFSTSEILPTSNLSTCHWPF